MRRFGSRIPTLPRRRELEPPQPEAVRREQQVIDVLLGAAPGVPSGLLVQPGDDAAVLAAGQAITVDALVEGVHWDDELAPVEVGFKAVAVSVSDLAAMGARPEWMVLALALPRPVDDQWVQQFASGVGEASRKWRVGLVGGDTTRTPGSIFLSITMGGGCVAEPLTRSTASPGDELWVTGHLGLAAAGRLLDAPPPEARQALARPDPPLAFALELARARLPTAMMDLSDGLAQDLDRLCRASRAGAMVDPALLPVHPALAPVPDPVPLQVGGGDDYQLLFTAPPAASGSIRALARAHRVLATRVGMVDDTGQARLEGRPWPAAFSHFGAP